MKRLLLKKGSLALSPILLWTICSAPVRAMPAPTPPPAPSTSELEQARESLQNLMILSMKKALELTHDQEMEIIPRVEQVFVERERYARQRRDALRTIQVKLQEESVPERDYRETVARLDDLERSHRELELRLKTEIDRSLNPRQRAQLRVFVPRFRRDMQMRIDEARSAHPRPRMAPAPPPPPDWDDEDEEF